MAEQVTGYEGTFPTILRELLECHPKTGEKTTLKALGEYVRHPSANHQSV